MIIVQMMMTRFENETHDEERAFYGLSDIELKNIRFDGAADGESALKECRNVEISDTFFNLRYPLWHTENATITGSEMTSLCRAALWYDKNITIKDSVLNGIKALRECRGVTLSGICADSPEFLWKCSDINITNSKITSQYPLFDCHHADIAGMELNGKYSIQYCSDITIRDSVLNTKDSFWHSENVTVTDSVINGEYLGWYSKNLKLVRCKIKGTQPFCYCEGLVLEDCEMEDTDFSFELSEVEACVKGTVISIKNPLRGRIEADGIDEVIFDNDRVNKADTEIIIRNS